MSDFIKLAFFSGKGDNKILAWFVQNLTGNYTHVEIIFQESSDSEDFITSSIETENTVYWKKKSFGRKDWTFLTISGLTADQIADMRNFCYKESLKSVPFNSRGMVRSITPFPDKKSRAWFCSEYIATALQKAGIVKNLVPSSTTPSSLYNSIVKTIPSNRLNKSSNPWFRHRGELIITQ